MEESELFNLVLEKIKDIESIQNDIEESTFNVLNQQDNLMRLLEGCLETIQRLGANNEGLMVCIDLESDNSNKQNYDKDRIKEFRCMMEEQDKFIINLSENFQKVLEENARALESVHGLEKKVEEECEKLEELRKMNM